MGSASNELLISAPTNSKGYQLMKAMGFKDRGSSKFSFKTYDDDSQSDEDQEFHGVDLDELEMHGLPIKRKVRPRSKFYTGPYTFKDNFAGIGYILAPNELCN